MEKLVLMMTLKQRNQLPPQASNNSSNHNQRKKARKIRREEIKMTMHTAIPLILITMN